MQTRQRHVAGLLGLAVIIAGFGAASADTVERDAARDNTLYSESDDRSNGAGEYVFAGRTDEAKVRRALFAFDLGVIPNGATITSVTLELHMSRTESGGELVTLHPVLTDWGEGVSDAPGREGGGAPAEDGDATWGYTFYDVTDPPGSPRWKDPGGDYAAAPSAMTTVSGNGLYTWGSTSAMVEDAQAWLDDDSSNFGWIMMGNESRNQTTKRFGSRQNAIEGRRPTLTITFTAPVCPADLDGSGVVDFGDVLAILAAWGNVGGPEDLDGSGIVDFGDLLVVLAAWGPCP